MCSTSIFTWIMRMIFNFTIFVVFNHVYLEVFLYKFNKILYFNLISVVPLLITSFYSLLTLIIAIVCSLKDLQNFIVHSLLLYTLYLFSMLLSEVILPTLKNLMVYVHLLLLWMNFQDYFYIH